jgi:hypothetical protein
VRAVRRGVAIVAVYELGHGARVNDAVQRDEAAERRVNKKSNEVEGQTFRDAQVCPR